MIKKRQRHDHLKYHPAKVDENVEGYDKVVKPAQLVLCLNIVSGIVEYDVGVGAKDDAALVEELYVVLVTHNEWTHIADVNQESKT